MLELEEKNEISEMINQKDNNNKVQRRRSDFSMQPATVLSLAFAFFSIIWAGGTAYQRLVYLESWKHSHESEVLSRASKSDLSELTARMEAEMQMINQHLEAELAMERAFSRSLCVALSHTQTAAGQPVTNDCARP